jgi:hypothetical protein
MKDKSTITKAFNKHLSDFLTDLQNIFPDSKEITFAKNSLETIKKFNTTAIIKVWYTSVSIPYGDELSNGNIDFFINKDYSQDLADVNKNDEIIKMIENIRGPISNTTEVNKQHSLKYLQNLNKLCIAYQNM